MSRMNLFKNIKAISLTSSVFAPVYLVLLAQLSICLIHENGTEKKFIRLKGLAPYFHQLPSLCKLIFKKLLWQVFNSPTGLKR